MPEKDDNASSARMLAVTRSATASRAAYSSRKVSPQLLNKLTR